MRFFFRRGSVFGAAAVVLVGFFFGELSYATCTQWVKSGTSTPFYGSAAEACEVFNGSGSNGTTVTTFSGSAPSGASGLNIVTQCLGTQTQTFNGSTSTQSNVFFGDVQGTVGNCPVSCANLPSQDIMSAISASSFNSGGLICVSGCGYTNSGSSMHITGGSSSSTGLVGQAVPTGAACAAGDGSSSALATSNCMESGGTTMCHQSNANVATVNNDIVNPSSPPPPGQCAAYADGAVECNKGSGGTLSVIAGPTTGGSLDTPTAVVTTESNTIDYFSPAQVAASATPVGSVNGGNISGNPAGTTGTGAATVPCTPTAAGVTPIITCIGASVGAAGGTGTGSGTAGSGSGDCVLQAGEAGADDPAGCSGTLPSLTRTDTVQSNMQALYAGIQATPLFAALGSVSSSFGASGSCPSSPMTLTTFKSNSFDFTTVMCAVFAGNIATWKAVSDTVWCLLGILIVFSA
jgi:hypothetical protein